MSELVLKIFEHNALARRAIKVLVLKFFPAIKLNFVDHVEEEVIQLNAPYRLGQLLDRIERQDRRKHAVSFSFGPYTFSYDLKALKHADGQEIRLTDKEADILKSLYGAKENGMERDELLRVIWGYADDIDTHTLETHIYRLRQKIEMDTSKPQYLCTLDKKYYLRMIG